MFGPVGKSELQKIFQESLRRQPAQELHLEAKNEGDTLENKLIARTATRGGENQFREAVVGLVVRYSPREPHTFDFLLTLRSDQLKEHASQVSFPGGMIEPAERGDHTRALNREVYEEVGIPVGLIEWELEHWDILPSLYGIRVFPYLGFVNRDLCPAVLTLQIGEVADVAWLDLWQLFDESTWGRRPLARAPWEWRGWQHVTWGLTGAFLALFVQRISGRLPS